MQGYRRGKHSKDCEHSLKQLEGPGAEGAVTGTLPPIWSLCLPDGKNDRSSTSTVFYSFLKNA